MFPANEDKLTEVEYMVTLAMVRVVAAFRFMFQVSLGGGLKAPPYIHSWEVPREILIHRSKLNLPPLKELEEIEEKK